MLCVFSYESYEFEVEWVEKTDRTEEKRSKEKEKKIGMLYIDGINNDIIALSNSG